MGHQGGRGRGAVCKVCLSTIVGQRSTCKMRSGAPYNCCWVTDGGLTTG